MIQSPHRRKGGAPQLGATTPGEAGPFGRRPNPDDDQDQEPADDNAPRRPGVAG